MSFADDYFNELNKKKKKKESSNSGGNTYATEYFNALNENADRKTVTVSKEDDDDDIAPVKGGEKDSWFKSGGFSDGVDGVGDFFGDLGQTVGGTVADLGIGLVKGAGRLVEGIVDLGTYGVAGVADLFGADEFADETRKVAQYSATDEWTKGATDFVDQYSVFGNNMDMVSEGLGQVATILLTGGAAAAGGLGTAGVTAVTTAVTGLSGMGSGMSEAYESGASDGEAFAYGATTGTIEAVSELIFGGLGKGVKALGVSKGLTSIDDVFAKKLSNAAAKYITSEAGQKVVGNTLEYAVKSGAEGLEEVISGFGTAIAKDAILLNEKDEKAFGEILKDENLLEQFVVGSIVSGIAQGGDFVKATKNGRDFVSGLSKSEQAVVDKLYEEAIETEEKNGKKLTAKEKNEMYDNIVENMDMGNLDIDKIEEILGGEDYKAYKKIADLSERMSTDTELEKLGSKPYPTLAEQYKYSSLMDKIKGVNAQRDAARKKLDETMSPFLKNSRLSESYNERARRSEAFTADLNQYEGKQREAVERAIKSGVLNNTNKTHALVNTLSKIYADKGIIFDYTNNKGLKELGYDVEGTTINGFANKSKGAVTLNVQSSKAWQSTVGHEIGHILKGTDAFTELQGVLYELAESKGELASRKAALTELYKKFDGDMTDDDIDEELTCDLIGDYLFSNKDFVNKLTGNETLFKKIWNEVKYLCKVATGKELTEIEKVEREFAKVWKEYSANGTTETDDKAKLSMASVNSDTEGNQLSKEQQEYFKDSKVVDDNGNLKVMYHGTETEFNEFNHNYIGDDNKLGLGFYFAEKLNYPHTYTKKVYLNITNPIYDNNPILNDIIQREEELVGLGKTKKEALAIIKSEFGYDGIIAKYNRNAVVVFDSNQIKEVNNTKPTTDPDIRYSVSEMSNNENKDLYSANESVDNAGKILYDNNNPLSIVNRAKTKNNSSLKWVYKSEIFSATENKLFHEKISEINQGSEAFQKNTINEYMIPIENKIIFTNGDYDSPYIREVIEVLTESQTEFEDIRECIYSVEKGESTKQDATRFVQNTYGKGRIVSYKSGSDGVYGWEDGRRKGKTRRTVVKNYLNKHYGRGNDSQINETTADLNGSASFMPEDIAPVDTKFSLSADSKVDSQGNELSVAVQKRFANSKAVDENGNLKVLYHGTASGEFYTFDKTKGSVEGDFGSGFYFTDNESDVKNNYEGGGPDFEKKVESRAEQIEFEEEIDYSEAVQRARKELYVGSNIFEVYLNIENPAIVGETNLFDYESYAENYDRDDYDSDEDYEGDIEQLIADDIDQIIWDIQSNVDVNSTDGIVEVLWSAVNEGGIDIEQLKANINNLYLDDSNGNLVGNEVTRQIIESLGYDGIIDNTVSTKFNMNLEEGTTHYIVFKPNQIKSIDNQNPTENPDIRYSVSKQGEQFAPIGNYSTPLNETALEQDIAPVQEAVAENTTPKAVPVDADIEEAPPMTDDDAPPEMPAPYYEYIDTTALDNKTLKNIGKSLQEKLSLNPQETKAIQEIVQEYSTSETSSLQNLFETIKEKFSKKVWKTKNEEIADVKRYLRTTKINVSPKIKSDIADYSAFRKSIGGKLAISKDGLPVDTAYKELVEIYPAFFSEDVANEVDQFLRMAEVASLNIYETETHQLDDEVIKEAVNIISNEIGAYKQNKNRIAAEEYAREISDSIAPDKATQIMDGSRGEALLVDSLENFPIETVEDKIAEKLRAVEASLADTKQLRIESENNYKRQIEALQEEYMGLKNKSTKKADDLVNRVINLQEKMAKIDADYAKRISDIEARIEKMNTEQYKRAMHKQDKMQEHAKWAANLLGDTSTWKDKKIGLQYATNTERRNLRDIVRDESGNVDIAKADAIDDALNGQYNREEAAKKRELTQVRGKYAEMNITKAEDAYIQMLGELRHNPETTLKASDVDEYYEKHKNKIDKEKVDKIIELARQDYDNFLKRVNEALREQGMKEIPYRQGYFPHFTEPKQNFIQKLFNWKTQDNEIPTSIAGLTETFRPSKSWQPFDKKRRGDTTDYSFMKGFDTYSQGVLDWIYHLDTLQKRRAVENHIRFTHSEEGIQKRIKEVYANEELDANEAQAQIEHILSEAENPLNNFIQDFTTHTNILAGKKNSLDRTAEQWTNRHIYSVMTNVQNRMSANMVLANVRSALTNFIPITQSWAQVSPARSLQAAKDTIANAIKDDGMIDKSTFLTNRLKEVDNLYNTTWDKVLDKAGIMFKIVDNISSQIIWRSKYNQNISKGMSESQAIKNADQFAENVMAGRSKGNEPTLFNAKNPVVKAFTMFQLEVNNQYGYLFKDVPNDLKAETNHWKFNLAKGYTTAFIGAYIYNALLEEVAGSGAALDPIGIIEDLLKDLGLFGDDEEEEPTEVITNLIENVGGELPFVGGTLFGGGRIPISSAMPYNDDGFIEGVKSFGEDASKTIKAVGDFINGNGDEADWSGLKNIGKEMMNPILNVGLPVGGGQFKKTYQGLNMFNTDEDHPVAGSYTDSGKLRFPVEDTVGNRIQAGIFGQYASDNAREYFDGGYAPLGEKQIQEYSDVDLPIGDYWKYRDGLKGLKTNAEKADYINGLDIKDWQKNLLMNNILDRKEDVDMSNYDDYSDYEEFDYAQKNPEKYAFAKSVGGYSAYKTYSDELNDIKADKDSNGKSITGSRKEKVINYINNLDADYEAKIILFKSEYPSDDTYNEEIINYINNREDLTYEERIAIFTELGFRVSDGYIYWD